MSEIVLPIRCSTVKTLYQIAKEVVKLLLLLGPVIGSALVYNAWYIVTYVTPIVRKAYTNTIIVDDTAFYCFMIGFPYFALGVTHWLCYIATNYSFTCIKDEEEEGMTSSDQPLWYFVLEKVIWFLAGLKLGDVLIWAIKAVGVA